MSAAYPFTLEQYAKMIQKALSLYHRDQTEGLPFADLILYQKELQKRECPTGRLATNSILGQLMLEIKSYQQDGVDYLSKQYIERNPAVKVAAHYGFEVTRIDRARKDTVHEMAQVLDRWESDLRRDKARNLNQHLQLRLPPPPDGDLVGVEALLAKVAPRLTAQGPKAARLLMLVGQGGLGKTTLANVLMRQLVYGNHFEDAVWVSAQQEQLLPDGTVLEMTNPALTREAIITQLAEQVTDPVYMSVPHTTEELLVVVREKLEAKYYLVVVDNLESVTNAVTVLELLNRLAGRSRFLLTSRQRLPQRDITIFPIPPLRPTDACEVMRRAAAHLGGRAEQVLYASDSQLNLVYEKLGGNPLALNLFVGQVQSGSLRQILAMLTEARGTPAQNLFDHIYRPAWRNMDIPTRRVFMAMPIIIDEGDDQGELALITHLSIEQVQAALLVLTNQNLVESRRRGNDDFIYHIHPLTRTFILSARREWKQVPLAS